MREKCRNAAISMAWADDGSKQLEILRNLYSRNIIIMLSWPQYSVAEARNFIEKNML